MHLQAFLNEVITFDVSQHLAFPAHGCLNEIGTFIVQASKLYILDHFDVSYSQKTHKTRVDAIRLLKACNGRDCVNRGEF